MNKLFTKVAALTIGVAMAAGVGVALGSANASEAKAAEETVTLDFATAGLTAFDSGTVNQGLSYTYVKDSGTSNPVFTKASGEAQYSLKLYNGNYLCIEISDTTSYASFKSIQCKVTSKNNTTSGSGTYYKDSLTSTSLYTHTLSSGTFVDGNTVDVDGASKVYIKCSAGQYRIGKFVIVMNKQGDVPSTQYNVTDSVENGSVSPSTVSEGATLTATITPDTGYNVPETVSVTMGGVAATHTYENGVVTVQNVTGDVEITGSCVEIPVTPEPAVVETTFADFIAATDADYAKAYHFSATIKAFKTGDTKDKYGNMTLTDGTTDLTVYGSTADATKLVWNGVSAKYEFTNPQDFMTTDLTNDSSVGDTVEVKFVRYFHNSKLNAQGIILSVTPGETPEIPEPEMVTGKKLSDLFADTAGNGKQLYEVTGVVSAWASGKSDATQYGNFYLKESLDSDTEYYIYGATADATKLVWGTASGVYGFSNPKDFLTNEVTKDVVIGSTLTMRLTRCDYNTTLEANGIVVSVVQPTPTDWSNEQKTALETALHGYLPPFFGELAEEMTTTENSAVFTVSGDHSAEFAAKLGDGWNLVSDNNYMLVGDNYYLTASIYTYGVRLDVGDYSEFTFTYHEGQPVQKYTVTYTAGQGTGDNYVVSDIEAGSLHALVAFETAEFTAPEGQQFKGWQVGNDAELHDAGYEVTVNGDVTVTAIYEAGWSSEMLSAFETELHGVIPSYDDSVSALEYVSSYSDFEMPFVATEEEALAELAILCNGWAFDSEYKEYSINTPDGLGVAVGWIYSESGSYSATIQFTQTHYPAALEAEMAQHMHGNVPPVLSNGVDGFVYYEQANMFVTTGAYNISALSTFQSFATRKGLVLFDSGTEKRPVAAASYAELEGTAYMYGGLCSDGGIIVVELFALTQYGALTINIYYLAQPLSIALSGEYKTTFEYGEQLDTTGMVVTATMSDETEQDVTSSAQFSGFDSLKEGEQTVTVTVGSVSTTYTITVKEKVLQKIEVTSEPTKVVYKVGEEFDPEGLEVTATYNGGDPVVLDLADVEISGFDSSTTGEKTVTVAFGGQTASFTVTVEQGYDADAFAKDLLDMVAPICNNYDGKKNNKVALKGVWDTMSQRYSTLSDEEKAKVIAAAAKTDGTDLEKAMAFYNYACKKYGLAKFIEGRQVKALVSEHETGNSILPIVVIVASSVAAITAIGVVIALKRRKALLAK